LSALTGMVFADEHLQQVHHHLAEIDDEIDEQIAAQRTLIGQLRSDGEETAENERLLKSLLEAQLFALAHRRLAIDLRR